MQTAMQKLTQVATRCGDYRAKFVLESDAVHALVMPEAVYELIESVANTSYKWATEMCIHGRARGGYCKYFHDRMRCEVRRMPDERVYFPLPFYTRAGDEIELTFSSVAYAVPFVFIELYEYVTQTVRMPQVYMGAPYIMVLNNETDHRLYRYDNVTYYVVYGPGMPALTAIQSYVPLRVTQKLPTYWVFTVDWPTNAEADAELASFTTVRFLSDQRIRGYFHLFVYAVQSVSVPVVMPGTP
jgi:hypothetical protein